jgi:hypothetical protein
MYVSAYTVADAGGTPSYQGRFVEPGVVLGVG